MTDDYSQLTIRYIPLLVHIHLDRIAIYRPLILESIAHYRQVSFVLN